MPTLELPRTHSATLFGIKPGDVVGLALAHPDDELPEAAAVRAAKKAGAVVHVIVATDGEASLKGDRDFVRRLGRRYEVGRSLARLGIAPHEQEYLELDDGLLSLGANKEELEASLEEYAFQHGITRWLTMGDIGNDHADHITVNNTVISVAETQIIRGVPAEVWGLTQLGFGTETVPFNGEFKDPLIDDHWSQFHRPEYRAELAQYGASMSFMESYRQIPLLGSVALY